MRVGRRVSLEPATCIESLFFLVGGGAGGRQRRHPPHSHCRPHCQRPSAQALGGSSLRLSSLGPTLPFSDSGNLTSASASQMGKGKSATEKKDVYKSKTAQLCSERRSSKAPVPVPEKVIRGRTSADGTDGKPQVPGSAISGQAKNETRLECKVLQPVVPDLEASTSDFCADDKAKPADTTGNSALDTAGAAPSLNVRAKDTLRKYHFRARGCKDGESCRHLHSSPEERHSGGHTVSRTGRETATRILKRLSANPKPRSPSDPAAGAGAGIVRHLTCCSPESSGF